MDLCSIYYTRSAFLMVTQVRGQEVLSSTHLSDDTAKSAGIVQKFAREEPVTVPEDLPSRMWMSRGRQTSLRAFSSLNPTTRTSLDRRKCGIMYY
jgi:hypothetical protein